MAATCDVADLGIVVVGGTTGLGYAAAKALVDNGARVVICGRSQGERGPRARRRWGTNARGFAGNAMDPATAERAVKMAVAEFGSLDGLYHVAGGSGRGQGTALA